MSLQYVITWYLFGVILFASLSYWAEARVLTVRNFMYALLNGCAGPLILLMIPAELFLSKYGDNTIIGHRPKE